METLQIRMLNLIYLRSLAIINLSLFKELTDQTGDEVEQRIIGSLNGKLNEPQLFWNEFQAALSEKDMAGVQSLGEMCLVRYKHHSLSTSHSKWIE